MNKMTQVTQVFGYHTDSTFSARRYAHDVYGTDTSICRYFFLSLFIPEAHEVNQLNVLGYLPLVGAWTGIDRLCSVAFICTEELHPFKATFICRGVCEILGLGILFLIPDIIVSIGRLLQSCYNSCQ